MASRMFVPFLQECKRQGYSVNLLFMWVKSPELAVNRVALRVLEGGHHVPEELIRRRYRSGMTNFFNLYQPLADTWAFYDNSTENPKLVACWTGAKPLVIHDKPTWASIQEMIR